MGYYVSMQATSPKKDTRVYYDVSVVSAWYQYADDGRNKYLYDKKTDPEHYNTALYSNSISPGDADKGLHLETDDSLDHFWGEGGSYSNSVGFGDEWDYAEISLSAPGTLSFTIDAYCEGIVEKASPNLKFTVYSLTWNDSKKVWSQKTLASQTITVDKQIGYVRDLPVKKEVKIEKRTTDDIKYFISVQSLGAEKGASVYYSVKATMTPLPEGSALAMPETDSLNLTDALSFGQYAAESDALADTASSPAEPDDISARQELGMLA